MKLDSKQVKYRDCPECCGDGLVEVEYERPQSFGRDVGYIESRLESCYNCAGSGEIEMDELDWLD